MVIPKQTALEKTGWWPVPSLHTARLQADAFRGFLP